MNLRERIYLVLAALFVTALVVADLIGGKFFVLAGVELSVGIIPFPITFLLTDVVNEFYGPRAARRLTYLGLAMAVFAFAIILLARKLPVGPHSPLPQAPFDQIFGMSGRLYIASLTAYLCGQFADIGIFGVVKRWTSQRHLWLRATGSTVVSQAIDTLVVSSVLLAGRQPLGFIVENSARHYVVKFVVAIALTPLLYAGHALLERRYGLEPVRSSRS